MKWSVKPSWTNSENIVSRLFFPLSVKNLQQKRARVIFQSRISTNSILLNIVREVQSEKLSQQSERFFYTAVTELRARLGTS